MFSSGPNYTKLKTNLRLAMNRLKLLGKKKSELAQKARREIADYIGSGKVDRARIRVEHIIREDYMVEAMEMLEMYCDLLLARFGLLQQAKNVDPGLLEVVAGILWAGPRLSADVAELKPICDQLTIKYGKEFVEKCRGSNEDNGVNEKFQHRLGVQAPSKLLVEKYLIEISKNFNVPYEPDQRVMKEAEANLLLDFDEENRRNNLGGGGNGGGGTVVSPPGFRDFPQPPLLPFNYPGQSDGHQFVGGFTMPNPEIPPAAFSYNIPMDSIKEVNTQKEDRPPSYFTVTEDVNKHNPNKPKPSPRSKLSPEHSNKSQNADLFPELPNVPADTPESPSTPVNNDKENEVDFDDLARRFENLKNIK